MLTHLKRFRETTGFQQKAGFLGVGGQFPQAKEHLYLFRNINMLHNFIVPGEMKYLLTPNNNKYKTQ